MIDGSRNLRAPGVCRPMEVRTNICAPPAALPAGKLPLNVRPPDVIRPSVAGDRDPMAAVIVTAVDQQTANTEGDLLAGRSPTSTPTSASTAAGRHPFPGARNPVPAAPPIPPPPPPPLPPLPP